MEAVVIGFIVFSFVVLISFPIIFNEKDNTLYCMIFERKQVKLNKEILSLPDDEFTFNFETFRLIGVYYFSIKSYPEWDVWFFPKTQRAIVSHRETHECILGSFYEKGSYQLYQKMCRLLPSALNNIRLEYINTFNLIESCEEDLKKKLTMINQKDLELLE